MPPRAEVRHLRPRQLVIRWSLDEDGDTKAGERYLANWRSQSRGPAYIRGESDGDKALILYPLSEVEAWEKRQLVVPISA